MIHRKNSKIEGSQNSTNEEFVYHKVENITDKEWESVGQITRNDEKIYSESD